MTNMKSQNKLVKERTPKQTNRRNKESKPHYSNEFNTSFFKCEPTKLQKGVLSFFRQNEISIITGEPGCGKDFVSLYFALEMLRAGSVERILITKPIVEIGKSIGFLPGSESEKYAPYEQSFIDNLQRIVGTYESNSLLNGKKISFQPINFVRGSTFRNSVVILSEAQNCTLHELVSFTTRVADDSKLLINGDLLQADIKNSGFKKYIELFSNIEGIDYLELGPEFQMRSKLIVDINRVYKEYLNK